MAGETIRLSSVSASEHELRFVVEIGADEQEVWFHSSAPISAPAEAAAVATLLPALARGAALRIETPVAPAVIDAMNEAQSVLCAWARSGTWPTALPFEREIEVSAPAGAPDRRAGGRGVAAFFSGGVDSLTTVVRHPEITHLIHIEGFDVLLERRQFAAQVRERISEAASDLGRELIVVETNVRELSDPHLPWVTYYGSALGAVALLLSGEMSRVLVASGITYGALYENGSHPLLDHLWGADRIEVVHDGASLVRTAKVERLAESEIARRMLRVCWENPGGAYNCGRCEKCLRTMVALEALGVRERFETFPDTLDLAEVAAIRPHNRPEIDFWLDNLQLAVRERADGELIEAVERCLANVDAGPRPAPSEPRYQEPDEGLSGLYMRPEARRRLADARATVFLVGSYEGWGNYGDVAQLQAALDLLRAELPDAVACPVLNLHAARSHELQASDAAENGIVADAPLYHAEPGADADYLVTELGLVPAVLPPSVASAVIWFYGGGYLNSRWGLGKLRMAEAARRLARRAGIDRCEAISSGLQIDSAWVGAIDDDHRATIADLRLFGVRDEISAAAVTSLAGKDAPLRRTGDDAIGVLNHLSPRAAPADGGPEPTLALNLHFCSGEWVADDARAIRTFVERVVVELAALADRRLEIQPLIAYEDPRMSERRELAELTAAIAARVPATSIAEPIVLTPASLRAAGPAIAGAALTVGCSYHVALTSLMLGVPAVLPRGNGYYAQKADALRRDFSLPEELLPDPRSDPSDVARAALAALAPANAGGRLELEPSRERVVARRAEAEAALAAELRAMIAAAPARRSASAPAIPPAEAEAALGGLERAYARIDALVAQNEWQASRLDDVERSASWRLTAPIRSAKTAVAPSVRRLARALAARSARRGRG